MQPVETLDHTMSQAIGKRASDVYFFPKVQGYEIVCHTVTGIEKLGELTSQEAEQLIAYVKYEANMAISEHRRPQLGALHRKFADLPVHLRLSTVGDFQDRESMVIRIIYALEQIGHEVRQNRQWPEIRALTQSAGLLVLSGPMGSGKTTTIYQLAHERRQQSVILSIEDPVEIEEPGFLQLQVNELAGMSYDALLKLALRHRPDVFIIGEIRDEQTAQVAVKAALSGHLVLSTVHAQNVLGVVSRLTQLGVAKSDLMQALTGVCYQRLIPGQHKPVTIYDWQTGDELFGDQTTMHQSGTHMTRRWHDALRKAVDDGSLAAEVAAHYQAG
ncbi:MAG TPA: competence protein ComGA [Lactobacillus sp.]|nr:competence protein ComGA [Lactobacillus sp.]